MITIKVNNSDDIRYKNNKYIIDKNKIINITTEKSKVQLKNISVGETFKIGNEEWIVLKQSGDTTTVLKKDLLPDTRKFDNNVNNFAKSEIYLFLNDEYYVRLASLIGTNNICEHTVDLTADDGLKDYKKCKANVSLLTCELYRKYTNIMLKYNPEKWWWLATAYSTPTRGNVKFVRYVVSGGSLNDFCCNYCGGVRPFIVLNNSLYVDEV